MGRGSCSSRVQLAEASGRLVVSDSALVLSTKMVSTYMNDTILHINAHNLGRSGSQLHLTRTDESEGLLRLSLFPFVQVSIEEAESADDDILEVWQIWTSEKGKGSTFERRILLV